ncbi:MAG: hypothetical protein KGI02_01390 [Thaumarchaeota archaeon]|nr:hypothetical protein [Nitrososphaerota archaeon]MDE1831001.1 hypothetical protein [Nitrososphaerota archaeon]MDE1841457.1 hypothetical protein [Nitrososphaerota archaeon]MDE1877198.1 hypothetical protein [Nitrososphaerota archaeon]
MPDKSCRTCGGDLIKWSACTECKKAIQKICLTCSEKTIAEFHSHHIHLEPYKIDNAQRTVTTIQSYDRYTKSKNPKKNPRNKNYRNILVISGLIVAIMILGMLGMSNPESFSSSRSSQIQMIIPSEHSGVIESIKETPSVDTHRVDTQHPSTNAKYTYSNCLGVSDGMHLTVTCPTEYGSAYKAVVDIPSELTSQFENGIFSLRGLAVTEHLDSISIQYAEKVYEAKFVNG